MVLFKAIILGILGWQLIELIRLRRRSKNAESTTPPNYIHPTTERPLEKELERSAPPAYYARV